MALNMFVVRKYAGIVASSMLTVMTYSIVTMYYGLLWGVVGLMVGLLVGFLVANKLLSHPFTDLVEGKGILALNLDSTGVIRPFICSLNSPYIQGKIGGKEVNDIFDRESTLQLATPKKVKGGYTENDKGGITIELDEKKYNAGRFSLFHYPVIIYNQQIDSIITKDMLSDKEKNAFAEHTVLYLNRKVEELTSAVRDFGRHVVENLKPKEGIFSKGWVWIVIIVLMVILGVMFLPAVMQSFQGVTGGLSSGLPSGAITPR